MNAHPKDRSERMKIDKSKKRRDALLKEILRKQEAEDARKEADRKRLLESSGAGLGPSDGAIATNHGHLEALGQD